MFPKFDKNANKQQPKANDENVRQEILKEEDQKSVQTMGNEAAYAAMLNNMLKAANSDNMLDLSGYEDQEEEIISYNGKKKITISLTTTSLITTSSMTGSLPAGLRKTMTACPDQNLRSIPDPTKRNRRKKKQSRMPRLKRSFH